MDNPHPESVAPSSSFAAASAAASSSAEAMLHLASPSALTTSSSSSDDGAPSPPAVVDSTLSLLPAMERGGGQSNSRLDALIGAMEGQEASIMTEVPIGPSKSSQPSPIAQLSSSVAVSTNKQPSTAPLVPFTKSNSASIAQAESFLSSINDTTSYYNASDVFLSLTNPIYKAVLFDHFQLMKENTKEEELHMAQVILELFQRGGGRLFKAGSRVKGDFVEVDDAGALEKIRADVRRRNESAKHWNKAGSTNRNYSTNGNSNAGSKVVGALGQNDDKGYMKNQKYAARKIIQLEIV